MMSFLVAGQNRFWPRVVILEPYEIKLDTAFLRQSELMSYESYFTSEEEKHILDSLSQKEEENIRKMDIAEFHFRKKSTFQSSFTLLLYGMITYTIFGRTENCLVLPSHDKSNGSKENYDLIASKYDVDWVVNPILLQSHSSDGKRYLKARMQVYNYKKKKILLDKEYEGDSENPGFELSCESGTIDCNINNVIGASFSEIITTIYKSK